MRKIVHPFILVVFVISLHGSAFAEEVHHAAPVASYGGIMNPDVSAVINTWALFSDDRDREMTDRVFMKEAELAFQSYLYPGVYGNFIVAMHAHDDEWKIHPEEAYVSFLDLPLGLQLHVGRRLVALGKVNAVHPHHWPFATQPLVLENFFGHAWFDDGVTVDWLAPNPWDVYLKLAFSALSGTMPRHHDEGDAVESSCAGEPVHWKGKSFNFRASTDIPFLDLSNAVLGYSAGWDEGFNTVIHEIDLSVTYRKPRSYKRLRWQTEFFLTKVKDESMSEPLGFYSMLKLTMSKYWETGIRYDMSEYFHELDAGDETTVCMREKEHAASFFISYYFTHSLYLRGEYRHLVDREDARENQFIAQLVWGLGPHAHRIED